MKLQQIICDKFSIGLFLAMCFLTLPLIAAAQGKIAFSSNRDGNQEIYVMNPDGSNQTRLTNNSASDFNPSLSTNGSKIAFESWRDGNAEIYVMNADGSNQTRLTNNPALDDFPAVNYDGEPSLNADGSKIVFTSQRNGNFEIYIMNSDGSNQINLTNNPGFDFGSSFDFQPTFLPNGFHVAFVSSRDGNQEIYIMNADGSNLNRLTNNPAIDSDPSFSPNGFHIAFRSNRDGGSHEIYVMNSDGSNQTNLTTNAVDDFVPAFSPDGSQIAFASTRDGNSEIYVMNADGSNQTRLINNPAVDFAPSWGGAADTEHFQFRFDTLFSPFRQNRLNPVDAGGDVSVLFHLNGFYGLDIYAAPPSSQRIRCSDRIPTGAIQAIQTTVSANPLYDANFDIYSTTWQTRQTWTGTCRRLILRLDDGTTHSLDFSFR